MASLGAKRSPLEDNMANLFANKPIDTILSEAHEEGGHALKRALGPVNLVTLGIGAIIGAGIFVLTGSAAAKYAGPAGAHSSLARSSHFAHGGRPAALSASRCSSQCSS